jgi:hypothetical protein
MEAGSVHIEHVTDVSRLDVAKGFCAITPTDGLRRVLTDVLGLGAHVVAAVDGSVLVGYAVDLPFLPIVFEGAVLPRRWQRLPDARELGAIEVIRPLRGTGLARALLAAMVSGGRLDDKIVLAEGLSWHWDHEASGLSSRDCRARLLSLFLGAGFRKYATDEPEIRQSPDNFLVARVGPAAPPASRAAFEAALMEG